jgi:hypothetical protein
MKSLPVETIVREAARTVWRKRVNLFRALFATGIALAALRTAQGSAWESLSYLDAVFLLASWIVFTLFAITCHRIVLIDGGETPAFGIRRWSSRETRFLGLTIFTGICFAIIAVLSIAVGKAIVGSEGFSLIPYVALLPAAYVSSRLSVLLPATAVDERRDVKWAWDTTAGNGKRLVLLVTLLPWAFGTVFGLIETKLHPFAEFVVHVLYYVVIAFEIAVLSVSYRFIRQAANQ